jgi:hypothetical protein
MLISKWRTFNGREIPVEELDRQHLSNIFWYHLICYNRRQDWALEQLKARFNGQPTEYRPHTENLHEIIQLEEQGNLVWRQHVKGEQIQVGEIMFEDKVIGCIWRYIID